MWHQNMVNGASGVEGGAINSISPKVGPVDRKQKSKLRTVPTGTGSINQRRSGTRFSSNPNVQSVQTTTIPSGGRQVAVSSANNNVLSSIGHNGGIILQNQTSQNLINQQQTVTYKNTKKIPIDRSKFHPSISNLAGAIIGVSGSNQKWMEQESGAQVQILGTTTNDPEGLHVMVRYNDKREVEIVEAIIDEIGKATFEGGGGFISHILPNRKQVPIGLMHEYQQGSVSGDNTTKQNQAQHSGTIDNTNLSNGSVVIPNYNKTQMSSTPIQQISPLFENNNVGSINTIIQQHIPPPLSPPHSSVPQNNFVWGFVDKIPIDFPKAPPTSPVEFEWLLHLVLHSALIKLGPMANHGVPMVHIPMFYTSFTNFRFENDATSFFHTFIIQNGLIGLIQALPHIFIEGPQTIVDITNVPKLPPIFKVNTESGMTPLLLPAQPITVSFSDFKVADEAFWKMGVLPPEFSNPNMKHKHFSSLNPCDPIYLSKANTHIPLSSNNANTNAPTANIPLHKNQSQQHMFVNPSSGITKNNTKGVSNTRFNTQYDNINNNLTCSNPKTFSHKDKHNDMNLEVGISLSKIEDKNGSNVAPMLFSGLGGISNGTNATTAIANDDEVGNGASTLDRNTNSNMGSLKGTMLSAPNPNPYDINADLNNSKSVSNMIKNVSSKSTTINVENIIHNVKPKNSKIVQISEIEASKPSNNNILYGKNNIPHTPLMIVLQGVHFLLRRWIMKKLAPHYIPKSSLDFLPLDALESEFSQYYQIPLNIETLGWTNLLHFVEAFPEVWTVENVGPDEFTLIPIPYPDFYMIAKSRGIVSPTNSNENSINMVNKSEFNCNPNGNNKLITSTGDDSFNINNTINIISPPNFIKNLPNIPPTMNVSPILNHASQNSYNDNIGISNNNNVNLHVSSSTGTTNIINTDNFAKSNCFNANGTYDVKNIIRQVKDFINEAITSGYPSDSAEISSLNDIIHGVNVGIYNMDHNVSTSLYKLVYKITSTLPKYSNFANMNNSSIIRPSRFDSIGRNPEIVSTINNNIVVGTGTLDSLSASTSSSATTSESAQSSFFGNNCMAGTKKGGNKSNSNLRFSSIGDGSLLIATNNSNEEPNIDNNIAAKPINSISKKTFSNVGTGNNNTNSNNSIVQSNNTANASNNTSTSKRKQNNILQNKGTPISTIPSSMTYNHIDQLNPDFKTIHKHYPHPPNGIINPTNNNTLVQNSPKFSPQIPSNNHLNNNLFYQNSQIPIENIEIQGFGVGNACSGSLIQSPNPSHYIYSNTPNPVQQFSTGGGASSTSVSGNTLSNNTFLKCSGKSNGNNRSNWDRKNKNN